jgi:hypothetical protein
MNKDGLQDKRLHEPLKEGLDYYDAAPLIEECAAALANLQAASQIQQSINQQLINLLGQALNRIEILEGKGHKTSALLLPPGLNS